MADIQGFPRLPYSKTWPDSEDITRAVERAIARGLPVGQIIKAAFDLVSSYQVLEARNRDYSVRIAGVADTAEQTAEHWNYLRNADFTRGNNGNYKWTSSNINSTSKITTNLPYGVRSGIQITVNSNDGYIQQSASAAGNEWYTISGWAQGGTGAAFSVEENSGSSPAASRTRRVDFKIQNIWEHHPDHNRPPLTFKTHQGTTRLTFRIHVKTSGVTGLAKFGPVALEKGRRPHPWSPNLVDRGGIVASLKTPGSASAVGNIVLSASTNVFIRQSGNKFIIGAT